MCKTLSISRKLQTGILVLYTQWDRFDNDSEIIFNLYKMFLSTPIFYRKITLLTRSNKVSEMLCQVFLALTLLLDRSTSKTNRWSFKFISRFKSSLFSCPVHNNYNFHV